MAKIHTVIVIPGLGDWVKPLEWGTRHWRTRGLVPKVHSVGWHDSEKTFAPKLRRLGNVIDTLAGKGHTVSLVGTSAGGSAAVNAFFERRKAVHRVINVCGRLRVGPKTGMWSFFSKTKTSPAFAQSVRLCEEKQVFFTDRERKKIMTVRAKFGDELVPAETATLPGAYNIQTPTPEHVFSIVMALTFFSKPLIKFLLEND